jgi:hypothetical protein
MCNKQTQIDRKDAFGIHVLGYNNFVLFNFPKDNHLQSQLTVSEVYVI